MTDSFIDDYLVHQGEKQTVSLWSIFIGLSIATLVLNGDGAPTSAQYRLKIVASILGAHNDTVGHVIINGTENLNFTSPTGSTKTTTTYLTAGVDPVITTTDMDCELTITALDTSGNPLYKTAWELFACRWVNVQKWLQDSTGTWILSSAKIKAKEVYAIGATLRKYGTTTPTYTIKNVFDAEDMDGADDYKIYVT